MSTTTYPDAERMETGRTVRAWYGVVGAPLAWLLHSSLSWFVTGRFCADGRGDWGGLSVFGVRMLIAGLGTAGFVAGWIAFAVSWRAWSERTDGHLLNAEGRGTTEYVALAGVLVSAVFLLAIVWATLPALMVDLCQRVR